MKEAWRRTCAEVRRCASAGGRTELGATVAEGYRLIERALRADADVRRVVVARAVHEGPSDRARALLDELAGRDVPLDVAPDAEVEQLTEGRDLGRLAALVGLPPEPDLDTLTAAGGTLLVTCDVRDPGNLGAILRTSLALGARALVAAASSELFHPRAVRTSLGSCFKLPLVQRPNAEELLTTLRQLGVRSVGAVARDGQDPRGDALDGRCVALWVGSEAFGLEPAFAASLDGCVTVPMAPGVDSLSVHVAAAVLLYERGRRASRP